MKHLTSLIFAVVFILLPQFSNSAKACTCLPIPTPYKAYQDAGAVLVGKVISSTDTMSERHYKFSVIETFKGERFSEVDVNAGTTNSSCFQGFTVGESYLLYAGGAPSVGLYSSACSRTTNLRWAAGDIYYIRALLKGMQEPRFYGAVARADNDLTKDGKSRATPLEGIKVIIEGEGKRFEVVSDKQGLFSIADIPDGRYKARTELPGTYRSYWPGEEEFILGSGEAGYPRVHQGDTAYADFSVGWNNSISGRVLDAEGKPLRRAKAAVLIASTDGSPRIVREDPYNHKPDGKYDFGGLTPGKYLLSFSITAPFKSKDKPTRFYYPNVVDPKQAKEVPIGDSDALTDKDIKMPQGYTMRLIEGTLVWPDGSPVENGWVFVAEAETSKDDENKYDWVTTDKAGHFALQGFEGAEYWVHSSIGTLRMESKFGRELHDKGIEEFNAKPVKVVVGKTNEPLRIVVQLPEGIEMPKK